MRALSACAESARCAPEDGIAAVKVVPGYQLNNPWFEYHPEDGVLSGISSPVRI